jgi:hypothetical protein
MILTFKIKKIKKIQLFNKSEVRLKDICKRIDECVVQRRTEEVGFEPTVRLWRTHAFQACSLSHSDTPPEGP